MLKKFLTLLCVGALAIAFVGCEKAEDAASDTAAAVEDAGDATMRAADDAADAAKEGAEKVKDAVTE